MIHIDQEPDRVPRRTLEVSAVVIAIGIIASVVATVLVAGADLDEVKPIHTKPPARFDMQPFELPLDAEIIRAANTASLQTYGWTDRAHDVIHIPIAVATELYIAGRRP
jgi:hypothetical protein